MDKVKHDKIVQEIAQACKEFRLKELGMTQAELARRLGTTPNHVSMFETGRIDSSYFLGVYCYLGFDLWKTGVSYL